MAVRVTQNQHLAGRASQRLRHGPQCVGPRAQKAGACGLEQCVITLRDDALFEAASAGLLRAGADTLRPVAQALRSTAGQVLVLGHTDSHAERSARFPSNWELSVERARAVHDALLLFGVAPARLRYDGRADTEPLAAGGANQPPVHSGRIEIVLLVGR